MVQKRPRLGRLAIVGEVSKAATLLYTPGVRLYIETIKAGIIDVTEDLSDGTITLQAASSNGGGSSLNVGIVNHRRKYDGVFTPNDRFSLQLKRITWLQVMSGYLTRVPYYSVYPRTVRLTAHCTMKRLLYRFWDEGAQESFALLQRVMGNADSATLADGGMDKVLITLLAEVAQWPQEAIHIGMVPPAWVETVNTVQDAIADRVGIDQSLIGYGTTAYGQSPASGGVTTVGGGGPGTGALPATSGNATWFGGPGGGAYGNFELTGESGVSPRDQWYCAMRWPYKVMDSGGIHLAPGVTSAQAAEARKWWMNQRILVTNPATNKSVVLRPADWGPASWTGGAIDMSRTALEQTLGIRGKGSVQIRFAPSGVPLGPYSGQINQAPAVGGGGTSHGSMGSDSGNPNVNSSAPQNWSIPAGANPKSGDMNWSGDPNGRVPLEKLKAIPNQRTTILLMPNAADAFYAMQQAAKQQGVTLVPGGGYRSYEAQVQTKAAKGDLAATPGTSNHGFGVAIDMAGMGTYGTPGYNWMHAHAAQYGWVHPPWAEPGGRGPHEPWHWEWWAVLNYMPGGSAVGAGGSALPGAGGVGGSMFNVWQWIPQADPESLVLAGPRALMNDRPLIEAIARFAGAAQRVFMAAPNGDFIAWFPDYFGQYGMLGKMEIQDIELEMPGFTIDWDDTYLVTHQFTAGAPSGINVPQQAVDIYQKFKSMGIASVDFPEIMRALFNIDPNDPVGAGFANANTILERFGARPDFKPMGNITSGSAEFWWALHLFQANWAQQFHTELNVTFMPELYPGMLIQLPTFKFQAYVEQVIHHFDFSEGGPGFSTTVGIIAPSATDGSGLYGLPRGGGPVKPGPAPITVGGSLPASRSPSAAAIAAGTQGRPDLLRQGRPN